MFWSLKLETEQKHRMVVRNQFHISMAVLDSDVSNCNADVFIEHESIVCQQSKSILCTLSTPNTKQQALDLHFSEGEEITFYHCGEGIVYLTGYFTSLNEEIHEHIIEKDKPEPRIIISFDKMYDISDDDEEDGGDCKDNIESDGIIHPDDLIFSKENEEANYPGDLDMSDRGLILPDDHDIIHPYDMSFSNEDPDLSDENNEITYILPDENHLPNLEITNYDNYVENDSNDSESCNDEIREYEDENNCSNPAYGYDDLYVQN